MEGNHSLKRPLNDPYMFHSAISNDTPAEIRKRKRRNQKTILLVETHRVRNVDRSFFDVMLEYENDNAPPCKLTLLDITRLMPKRYLPPELIRFAFYHALKERVSEATRAKIALIDPLNFPSYLDAATQEEKDKFHEQYPLQGKQWLVMPCFWEGTSLSMPHWYLVIVNNLQKILAQRLSDVGEQEEEVVGEDKMNTKKLPYNNYKNRTFSIKVTFLNSNNPVGSVHYKISARPLRKFLAEARLRATGVSQKITFNSDYPKKIPQQNTDGDSGLICVEYFVAYFKLPPSLDFESVKAEERRFDDVRHVNPNAVSRTRYQLTIYQLITDQEKRARLARHLNWNVLRVPKDGLMMVNGDTEQRVTAEQLITLLNTGDIVPGCAASTPLAVPRAIALANDQPEVQVLPKNRITTTIERVD